MRGEGAEPLSIVIAIVVVLGILWLSSRGRQARVMRERVDAPAVLPRESETVVAAPRLAPPRLVPRPTVPATRAAPGPRLTISADRAASAASASVHRSRPSATSYMLRRRGLCSPDPHP